MTRVQQIQAEEEIKKQQEQVKKAVEAAALAEAEKDRAEEEARDLREQLARLSQLRESASLFSNNSTSDTPPTWLSQLIQAIKPCEEPKSRVSFRDEAEALEEFSGLDEIQPVTSWTESIEEAAAINQWTPRETFLQRNEYLQAQQKSG